MDWYAWLSKTNLDATLIYEYGLALARNELEEEDLPFFNHDFLQSLGISVAKHRLEILKLCRKEVRGGRGSANNSLSRLVLVMSKTRKLFARNISRLGFHNKNSPAPDMSPYQSQWGGALRRIHEAKENQQAVVAGRNVMWSGPLPLDRRLQEKLMGGGRCPSVSGPLDVKMQYQNWSPMVARHNERSSLGCRSPAVSGPIDRLGLSPKVGYYNRSETMGDIHDHDHDGPQSLWSIMFQDMKPT